MNRQQLIEQIRKKNSFLCVGLDTDISKIPAFLQDKADPVFEFNKAIIDATKDYFTKPAPKERDCPSKSIINIETGEIYIFTSYKKVEQELGLKSNKLYEVVKGNKLSYKGWKAYIN